MAYYAAENRIGGREGNTSLYLDLEDGIVAGLIVSVDNYVVERAALSSALKLNGVDRCPRQASWLSVGQHAE